MTSQNIYEVISDSTEDAREWRTRAVYRTLAEAKEGLVCAGVNYKYPKSINACFLSRHLRNRPGCTYLGGWRNSDGDFILLFRHTVQAAVSHFPVLLANLILADRKRWSRAWKLWAESTIGAGETRLYPTPN
jgi:hypothetical protein